jgi:hypothetical protein
MQQPPPLLLLLLLAGTLVVSLGWKLPQRRSSWQPGAAR